jgi:hypothetical protein
VGVVVVLGAVLIVGVAASRLQVVVGVGVVVGGGRGGGVGVGVVVGVVVGAG